MAPLKIIPLLVLSLFISCKAKTEGEDGQEVVLRNNIENVQNLSAAELAIAQTVCEQFQLKKQNLLLHHGRAYNFNVRVTDCSNNTSEASVASTLKAQDLAAAYTFLPSIPNNDFFDLEQSHEDGYLDTLCSDVLQNTSPKKTVTENNNRTQYRFFKDELARPNFSVTLAQKNTSGKFLSYAVDTLTVSTASDTWLKGLVIVRSYSRVCSNSDNYSSVLQTYLP